MMPVRFTALIQRVSGAAAAISVRAAASAQTCQATAATANGNGSAPLYRPADSTANGSSKQAWTASRPLRQGTSAHDADVAERLPPPPRYASIVNDTA